MTEGDLNRILDACKPVAVITGNSPQENANLAWAELGKRMGFDYMTVQLMAKEVVSLRQFQVKTKCSAMKGWPEKKKSISGQKWSVLNRRLKPCKTNSQIF